MSRSALSKSVWVISVTSTLLITGCTDGQPKSPDQTTHPKNVEQKPGGIMPKAGGELVIATPTGYPIFDPLGFHKKESVLHPYEQLTYRGLVNYAADGSIAPALASAFRIDRTGPKPVIELTLRKGATWSDGKPVTVEDVQDTLALYARPDFYGIWRQHMHLIQGVSEYRSNRKPEIDGITVKAAENKVIIAVERDDINILHALTAPLLPKHQLDGKNLTELAEMSKNGQIIGAGPMQIKEISDNGWHYTAHTGYYDGKPHLQAVRIVKADEATIAEEVKNARVHLSSISPDMAQTLAQGDDTAAVKGGAAGGYHFIGFNTQHSALKDNAIRKALAQATPVEKIAKEQFFGYAKPVKSVLANGSFAYIASETPIYDLEAAKKALAAKGYTKEKPLTLTLTYAEASTVRDRMLPSILATWEQLPVRMEKQPLPSDKFLTHVFGGSETDLYLHAWRYPSDPAHLWEMWHGREIPGQRGLNASRYQNQEADNLLVRGQQLLTPEERKPIFTTWQKTMMADVPIIPLVEIPATYYVSRKLQGVEGTLGQQPFANIHGWWLD